MKVELTPHFFTDWNLALQQLSTSNYLAIDNRELLIEKLQQNIPIAYFPGAFIRQELEFFALQAIRSRLGLPIEVELTEETLLEKKETIAPVYIFAQKKKLGKQLNKEEIIEYIKTSNSEELKVLYNYEYIKIISTEQLCVGIHFPQLGEEPLRELRKIREDGGFLLTNRRHAALMTDIVNLDRFHIGKVRGAFSSSIMGIPEGSGYIQYVPAGLRTTLAYPTPVQNAKDLNIALQSKQLQILEKNHGKKWVLDQLRLDAETKNSPVRHVLNILSGNSPKEKNVSYEYLSGIYHDGKPYNGVLARLNIKKAPWDFVALISQKPRQVTSFVRDFEKDSGNTAEIAWNGGYILNAELVGKLGLPESYIGSPLGFLVSERKTLCPPLFNKAALLIFQDGSVNIKRVNCRKGLRIKFKNQIIEIGEEGYNKKNPENEPVYYDLMYPGNKIKSYDRTIIRLSGNKVMEVIKRNKKKELNIIPVGITLSFPGNTIGNEFEVGMELEIEVIGMEKVHHAIEAGPMLLSESNVDINMKLEGWKTINSIATQAARLDFEDMRGPKIAVGLNNQGELIVLAINGRIRESVGATHKDMGNILKEKGMVQAMGFDPGGSSTLVVGGKIMNISPYNRNYEHNNYSFPPEPRAVSNAIIGFLKK